MALVGWAVATEVTSVVGTAVVVVAAAAVSVEAAGASVVAGASEVDVGSSVSRVAAPKSLVVVVVGELDGVEDGAEPDPELAPVHTAGPGILYSVKAWYRLKTMPGSA